jgi:hypothetical protein
MKQYMLFVAQSYHFYADIYIHLSIAEHLYMFLCPILVSMASLLTSCNNLIMQNIPFNGAGRRLAPPPFLAIIPSPTVIYLYFHINPLCVEYVCIVSYKNM